MDDKKLFEVRKQIVLDQARLMDEASFGMIRWFCTSLFVLNVGALAGSVGIQEVRADVANFIGVLFSAGIATAMLSAFFLGMSYSRNTWELFEKAWSGVVFEADQVAMFSSKRSGNRFYYLSLLTMALSAAALIVGALELSQALKQGSP